MGLPPVFYCKRFAFAKPSIDKRATIVNMKMIIICKLGIVKSKPVMLRAM